MTDMVLTGRERRAVSDNEVAKMIFLTAKELEAQDSALANWNVAIVDNEAKYGIECGETEKKSNFCQYKPDFTAR